MSSNKKEGEKNERREDPFKRILSEFEKMSRSIDEMMKREMGRNTLEKSFNDFNSPEPEEEQTISFSFSIEQGPNGIVVKPAQADPKPQKPDKENKITDVIEKEKHIDILTEINTEKESEIAVKLLNDEEIEIKSLEGNRRIKLPSKAKRIKKKDLKNGVLQIKISKKD